MRYTILRGKVAHCWLVRDMAMERNIGKFRSKLLAFKFVVELARAKAGQAGMSKAA